MAVIDMTIVPDDEVITVTSLSDSIVSYRTPSGVEREFPPKATFKIKAGELRELFYDRGGKVLLQNYLKVGNPSLAHEFGVSDDVVEYNWTDKEIDAALTTASMDVLLDALDFAPTAIVNRLVNRAVELEIPDINRMEAITKSTGLNIFNMIQNKRKVVEESTKKEKRQRRVTTETSQTNTETSQTSRRIQA